MTRSRLRSGLAGLLTVFTFVLLGLAWKPAPDAAGTPGGARERKPRAETKPIKMATGQTELRIALGLKDAKATDWDGDVQLSEGRLVALDIVGGNVKKQGTSNRFTVRSVIKPKN